jgi:hypothetical protein
MHAHHAKVENSSVYHNILSVSVSLKPDITIDEHASGASDSCKWYPVQLSRSVQGETEECGLGDLEDPSRPWCQTTCSLNRIIHILDESLRVSLLRLQHCFAYSVFHCSLRQKGITLERA